jgi:hypothetical protein
MSLAVDAYVSLWNKKQTHQAVVSATGGLEMIIGATDPACN